MVRLEREADSDQYGQGRWGDIQAIAPASGLEISSLAIIRQESALQLGLPALEQIGLSLGSQAAAAWSVGQGVSHRGGSAALRGLLLLATPALGAALTLEAKPPTALARSAGVPRLRLCASPMFVNLLGPINTACEAAGSWRGLRRIWERMAAALGRRLRALKGSDRRTESDAGHKSVGRRWWEAPGGSWWEQRSGPWWKQQVDPWWKPKGGQWWE